MAFTKVGYGQVEPNHLSAQRTGQIYAQLPADNSIQVLENGQYVKYDYVSKKVNFTGAGEWMMVFNEVKLYDTLREHAKDFAMRKADAVDGEIVPRVIKTNIGDIYTTSCITNGTYEDGDYLTVASATGFLEKAASGKPASPAMCWQVVDSSATMADGTAALKIMRIQ